MEIKLQPTLHLAKHGRRNSAEQIFNNFAVVQVLGRQAQKSVPSQMLLR